MTPRPGTRVLLARHGQSTWNQEKRVSGQMDPPLSPKGARQALQLSVALEDRDLAAVYSSPLARSRETARPAAESHGLPLRVAPELREMGFGALEGRYRDARDPAAQLLWNDRASNMLRFRAPGGEDFADLRVRIEPWLRRVLGAHKGQTVLIVGHRNVNRVVLSVLLQRPLEELVAFPVRSGDLHEIDVEAARLVGTRALEDESLPVVRRR